MSKQLTLFYIILGTGHSSFIVTCCREHAIMGVIYMVAMGIPTTEEVMQEEELYPCHDFELTFAYNLN